MNKDKKPSNKYIDKISELTDALQRERADAMNIRRQHGEQMANLRNTIKSDVVIELLPVIDNFERALKHVPNDLADNDYVKGVNGVVKQFEKVLEQMGVERINTVGEQFNPYVHEAVSAEDGTEIITEELQSGYKIGNDVIRPAMVKLGK